MRLAMIGTGYVGLVSGACFADFGHTVVCVDSDAGKIEQLKAGVMPIYEPGLAALVERNVRQGRLSFTTALTQTVAQSQAVFIAVGTPSRRGDGHADLSFVRDAARQIAPHLTGFAVVVTKSTVPVGAGDEIEALIRATAPSADFAVVSNPEFLREGSAIEDFKRPDRVVVGLSDERARSRDGGDLSAAQPERDADDVHRPAHFRTYQICVQRVPGDEDRLHQRVGRRLRKARR